MVNSDAYELISWFHWGIVVPLDDSDTVPTFSGRFGGAWSIIWSVLSGHRSCVTYFSVTDSEPVSFVPSPPSRSFYQHLQPRQIVGYAVMRFAADRVPLQPLR